MFSRIGCLPFVLSPSTMRMCAARLLSLRQIDAVVHQRDEGIVALELVGSTTVTAVCPSPMKPGAGGASVTTRPISRSPDIVRHPR